MIVPESLTPDQLRFAMTRRVGDRIIPSAEMVRYFRLKSIDLTIRAINNQPNGSQSDLAFQVSVGHNNLSYYDASWFRWDVPVDPRFVDPVIHIPLDPK